MITLLKSGYVKIMKLFYKDKTIKLHFREIVRQAKLHEPSTSRFLSNLESDKILVSETKGNLKEYFIKRSKNTYLIFESFDIEKFLRLPLIRRDAVEMYLDSLAIKPIFAILFGSTAKENYREDSDIDIMLVTNHKISTEKAQGEVNALTSINIGAFQIDYDSFLRDIKMKGDKVLQSAINSGYPLINHINYYEVLYNERV